MMWCVHICVAVVSLTAAGQHWCVYGGDGTSGILKVIDRPVEKCAMFPS